MNEINEVRLLRKFNCKQKIRYSQQLWLICRIQLVYQLIILIVNCIVNLSFHFRLSHVYTTQFWTSEDIASSNFGLALSSLLMIPYTVKVQQAKGTLIKDIHFTILFLHIILCYSYNNFTLSFSYILFACILGAISIKISSFASKIAQQTKLQHQIMQIESDDRKTYKKVQKKQHIDLNEHNQLKLSSQLSQEL